MRWWATDAALVDCATNPNQSTCSYASKRLRVILSSYTVYLDLWALDTRGNVLANGRPDRYRVAGRVNVGKEKWFQQAMATTDGGSIRRGRHPDQTRTGGYGRGHLRHRHTRRRGSARQASSGLWEYFSTGRRSPRRWWKAYGWNQKRRRRTRCMLLDSKHRVLASSDRKGALTETFPLKIEGDSKGNYVDGEGAMVGYLPYAGV